MFHNEQNPPPFIQVLQQISKNINNSQFSLAIETVNLYLKNTVQSEMTVYQNVELLSIKAYALMMNNKYFQAEILLEQCLKIIPQHMSSHKRKAVLYEKMGKIQECKKEYQICLLMEPQSRSINHKLKRLNMKSHNSSSCEGWSSDSKESNKDEKQQKKEESKKQKNGVKFGNFQIIDVETEDSDERFAIIREEINKISQSKPKKSILKEPMSASVFKEKNYAAIKQSSIIKSEQGISETVNAEDMQLYKKISLKKNKKSKSVSFNDPGNKKMEDFN